MLIKVYVSIFSKDSLNHIPPTYSVAEDFVMWGGSHITAMWLLMLIQCEMIQIMYFWGSRLKLEVPEY